MDRTCRLTRLALAVALLLGALVIESESHPFLRPLCKSQFALANHACAKVPFGFTQAPPSPMLAQLLPAPEKPLQLDGRGHGHHGHGHGHGHGHHGHGHGRHTRSTNSQAAIHQTPEQEECCRWLRNLDDACVCDMLVYLPVSLSKPAHGYSVVVDGACEVKFECPGRLVKL